MLYHFQYYLDWKHNVKSTDDLDLEYGLPTLISESEKKKALQKKRSKVLTQSVARKVTRIVEAFDEAGTAEDEKALILKAKRTVRQKKKKNQL